MSYQKLIILGATGSLGTQTLEILQANDPARSGKQFEVVGISANRNAEKLLELCDAVNCEAFYLEDAATGDARQVLQLKELLQKDFDHLMVLDHGLGSFEVVAQALAMKKRVSIANKELLIVHGADLMYLADEQQAELIPLDSEHNALYQCLKGERLREVDHMIITASGGPFLGKSADELKSVTVQDVLKHPTWSMGSKTTIDSATLVNKAFEVIEAHQLFGVPYDKVQVRLHPQSIVHAIVTFTDGSSKMLAYPPNMKYSLGYALYAPDRCPWDLAQGSSWSFEEDLKFLPLQKGMYPCYDYVLEVAKERPHDLPKLLENDAWAIEEFLKDRIAFVDIVDCLRDGLE